MPTPERIGARQNIGHFDHDVEEPVAARILREVDAVLDLVVWKRPAAEHAEGATSKAKHVGDFLLRLSACFHVSVQKFHTSFTTRL